MTQLERGSRAAHQPCQSLTRGRPLPARPPSLTHETGNNREPSENLISKETGPHPGNLGLEPLGKMKARRTAGHKPGTLVCPQFPLHL